MGYSKKSIFMSRNKKSMKKTLYFLIFLIIISCASDSSSSDDTDADIEDVLSDYDPEADDDLDGIINALEDLNNDGDPTNDDTDGDGVPDYLDTDDDGDGILTIDENGDADCDEIPDYLDDYDLSDYLNGVWKLIYVGSGSSPDAGSYSSLSSGFRVRNDTLRYFEAGPEGTLREDYYIYLAKLTIDYPMYEYHNTTFRGITNTVDKDTLYTKSFNDEAYAEIELLTENVGVFYIDDDFRYLYNGGAEGYFCDAIVSDTLKFEHVSFNGHSHTSRKYHFVRD